MSREKKPFIREPINSITHGVGAIAALIGLIFLVRDSLHLNSNLALLSSWFFGLSMILLYTSSSLYHWFTGSEKVILWLKKVDHMMIFILIAGSYTPYTLIALPKPLGWIIFGLVWFIAISGILLKIFWIHAPRWLSTGIYLAMGWFSVFIFPSLDSSFTFGGYFWLAMGGLAYSVGAVIYATKKPNPFPLKFGFHEIWHLFVMAGTLCHFISIYWYVIPIA